MRILASQPYDRTGARLLFQVLSYLQVAIGNLSQQKRPVQTILHGLNDPISLDILSLVQSMSESSTRTEISREY